MKQLARQGKINGLVRQTADNLTKHLRQKDWIGEIKALHAFVRDEIRFVRDINGVETVQYADQILRNGTGDCDDKSILLGSLLESIGHPARFVAVGFKPGSLVHVYVETLIGRGARKKWLPLETTECVDIGWRPPNIKDRMIRHI